MDDFRKYNRFIMTMCGLAGLLYGIDVGLISAALPYIKATCGFTPSETSSIVAAVLLGAIPGSFLCGWVADRWGRLAAFRLTAVVFFVAVPLICCSGGNFHVMYLGRILQGAGCGLVGMAAPLVMAECADAKSRGKGTGMIQLVLTVGLVVAALVGVAVTKVIGPAESAAVSEAAKNLAWQLIFWFSVIPTVFMFLGSLKMKETPRWLFMKGRLDEARESLLMNNSPEDADAILADMRTNASGPSGLASGAGDRRSRSLLQRKYLLPWIIAFLIMCFTQATGINSVLNYSVVIFQKAGLAGTGANWADTAIKFANFAMTIFALALVDRRGRKFLLTIGVSGAVLGLASVGVTFFALEKGVLAPGALSGWLVAGGFIFFIAAYGIGPGVCVWLANSELMPLRIRAKGMVVNGLGNAATSFVIAQSFLPWSEAHGESSVFFTLAGLTVLYLLTVAFLLPETKGRSLEEIERHFAKKS